MQYEHLIEVNDPLNPLIDILSREQLWRGLVLRAEQPELFVLGLDECVIRHRTDALLERELHYGQAVVKDRVVFEPLQQVRYETAATDQHAGGTLTMSIEEPAHTRLFVRFSYATTLPENSDAEALRYSEFVKSAYREADIDTVRRIREYAQSGQLD
ncbi:SRPBCC family protein [Pandoraea sp.]|uniref:SRPBCC family protein n=1 Tax=Pandoraea sp. TaxID=1883445 RepID=UPI0011F748D2|nr:SRPBCC family protein [Pandoraea sp.]TAL55552.1 MAG: DUF1857 family protein [Pandoraea sp.]TAM20119.1 MAG: DUF1857 family protein [Pandoraea sp.]